MKIRILKTRIGPHAIYLEGKEYEFEEAEARRLIEAGKAEPVEDKPTETAMKPPSKARAKKHGNRVRTGANK